MLSSNCGSVFTLLTIVSPNDNLGKSSFIYYILLRQLSEKKPTALQVSNQIVLFRDSVQIYSRKNYWDALPEGILALTGANKRARIPCNAFLDAERDGNARIIQATSLSWDSWKGWQKKHQASVFVMDYFSFDEIKALGLVRLNFCTCFFLQVAELFPIELSLVSTSASSSEFTICGVLRHTTACGIHSVTFWKSFTK